MNYLAQGLQSGFAIGAEARAQKKRQEQEDRMQELRAKLELDRDATRYQAEKDRQNERFVADAARQFADQTYRSGEGEKERDWRTLDRLDTQGFTREEREAHAALQRDLQKNQLGFTREQQAAHDALQRELQQKQLDQAERQFGQKLPLEAAHIGILGRNQLWQENPDNPRNQLGEARADDIRERSVDFQPNKSPAAGPKLISSQEEYNRLPSGALFIWGTRNGRKP